jgi:hypothetical protein
MPTGILATKSGSLDPGLSRFTPHEATIHVGNSDPRGIPMHLPLSRRQFVFLSAFGFVGAAGYGLTRAVRRVRNSASRMADS